MGKTDTIRHPGRVDQVLDHSVKVQITTTSGCASCYVKGACNMAEMEEKTIEVMTDHPDHYFIGKPVTVEMDLSTGTRAVMLGYILPLLLMLAALVSVYTLTSKDGLAGLAGISILIPYYLSLYRFKDKLKRKTVFRLVDQAYVSFDIDCPSSDTKNS